MIKMYELFIQRLQRLQNRIGSLGLPSLYISTSIARPNNVISFQNTNRKQTYAFDFNE